MKFGTGEFSMFCTFFANWAVHNFELFEVGFVSVPEETKEHVVHVRFSESSHQIFISQWTDHRILQGFCFVGRSVSGQKLESKQKRFIRALHLNGINEHIIEIAVSFLGSVTNMPFPQNHEIVVIFNPLQNLLGMTDIHLYFLRQLVDSFVDQACKERQLIKNSFIGFF